MNRQTNRSVTALGAAERSDDERSKAERSAAAPNAGADRWPDPEVRPRARRRSFTAAYKQKILAEADATNTNGGIGALLRREGLYSSHLTHWRQERSQGIKQGLTPRTRGPKPRTDPSDHLIQQLRRQNERLAEQLRKAEIIIDVQKKVATLWGLTLAAPDPQELR